MRCTPRLLFLMLLALASLSANLYATNATAGNCFVNGGGNGFTTIQAAVNGASSGGTVYVCPGTYPEQVTITKPLRLMGVQVTAGTLDAPVIVPPVGGIVANGFDIFSNPVAAQIFVASSTGTVTVSRLTVDGTGNDLAGCVLTTLEGIYFQNTSGTISDNAVRNQYQSDYADFGGCQNGLAINVESAASGNTVTVNANSVRAYQKNGITATGAATGPGALGPHVTISNNYIVGLAATALNWPKTGAAENGVQIGFGATGSVSGNIVIDDIWAQDTYTDSGDAASGILVYASPGITVSNNEVGSTQFGIVTVTDATYGPADTTMITGNKVAGTQIFDGIDVCSSSNTVHANTVFGSTDSGIHVDSTCGSGNGNTVSNNTINEACTGILTGSGTGNTLTSNNFFNVTNTTQSGNAYQCPVPPMGAIRKSGQARQSTHQAARPSPYMPSRN